MGLKVVTIRSMVGWEIINSLEKNREILEISYTKKKTHAIIMTMTQPRYEVSVLPPSFMYVRKFGNPHRNHCIAWDTD